MEDQANQQIPSSTQPPTMPSVPHPTFIGNTNDMVAVVGAVTAGIAGLCCITGGYGIYCLPIVPIVLGIAALINASQSVDPERTRRWGWVSLGVGGGVLVLLIVCGILFVLAYGALIYTTLQNAPYYSPYR